MSIEAVIAAGRRLVATTYLDTCTVLRRSLTTDSSGGRTEVWAPVVTGVPCRFGTVRQEDPKQVVDAVYTPPTAQALLPLGTDVRRGDRLRNETSEVEWLVVGLRTPDSETAVTLRAMVREVDT